MVSCCAPGCTNSQYTTPKPSFYSFPKDERLRRKWIKAIRRANWEPTKSSVLCSWHFPNGREYGPTRFHYNETTLFNFSDPSPKRARREVLREKQPVLIDNSNSQEISPKEILNNISQSTQVNFESSTIKELEESLISKQAEIHELKRKVEMAKSEMRFKSISQNETLVYHYTGISLPSFQLLVQVIQEIPLNYYSQWSVTNMSLEDQLLVTLMKLRHNFTLVDLAYRFGLSTTTISNIFRTIIYAIHKLIYLPMIAHMPDLLKTQASLPNCFQSFPNCRQIWDCTDVFIERPRSNLIAQKTTYSSYKGGNTLKALVCISPNGSIVYTSDLFGGNISDKGIVQKCGILTHLQAGDLILADKGFLISDILPPGVTSSIPPFVPSSRQFTINQIHQTRNIARSRVHVERAIQRLKSFDILLKLPIEYLEHATIIFQVCVVLVNLQKPILHTNG